MAERRFILAFQMAPGDVSMLTALVRDLKLTYGERYLVDVRTNFPDLWRNNPYLTPLREGEPGVEYLSLQSDAYIEALKRAHSGERIHFIRAFHMTFERRTGIRVPLLHPRPDYHLTEEERTQPFIRGRYWVVVPGGKLDATTKIWSQRRWQDLVDRLRRWGLRFVQEGATKKFCVHPPLQNVLSVVGMTSIRDLMRNVYHAEGVICGITFPMHLAAGLEKPCVVVAGGREEPWWEAYDNTYPGAFGPTASPVRVPHRYLHTLGRLPCCARNGCWAARVVPIADNRAKYNNNLCKRPVHDEGGQILPECLRMISVDHVVAAVMSYYEDATLPPPCRDARTHLPTST